MTGSLLAISIIVGGVAVAALLRAGLALTAGRLESRDSSEQAVPVMGHLIRAAGQMLFWALAAAAVLVASRILVLPDVSGALEGLLEALPRLLTAVLLLIGGHLGGRLLGYLAARGAGMMDARWARLTRTAVHLGVILLAAVLALGALGFKVWWLFLALVALLLVVAAAIGGALGLGSVRYVESLLTMQELRPLLTPGARVRIGETEGRLVEVRPTMLVLETVEGTAHIPAPHVEHSGMTLLGGHDGS